MWPENWPTFTLFCALQTQWRVAMGGPTGLDYSSLYPLLDRVATSATEWEEMFSDIQLLELEALAAMNEKD